MDTTAPAAYVLTDDGTAFRPARPGDEVPAFDLAELVALATAAPTADGNTTGPTVLWTTDPHGARGLRIVIEPTFAAERAALAFLARHMPPYTGGSDYRVSSVEDVSDRAGADLIAYLFPTCEHGMDATLCMGPDHYPSAEQERAWEV